MKNREGSSEENFIDNNYVAFLSVFHQVEFLPTHLITFLNEKMACLQDYVEPFVKREGVSQV